jgi:DNA-binding transcriptional ArsR family regulator
VADDLEERLADASALQTLFVALAHPARRYLLEMLEVDDAAAGDLAASAAARWGITRTRASQHLQVLANAGLVQVSPDGAWRYYRREPGAGYPVIEWLRSVELVI